MARYWTSDLHLGHQLVANHRGLSVEQHDQTILSQIYDLGPNDELWILGDISSGRSDDSIRALNLLGHAKTPLHLIAGNHDAASSTLRNAHKNKSHWLYIFDSIQQFGVVKLGGKRVLMSHYPYAGEGDGPGRGPERDTQFRLADAGKLLLHGHTHQPWIHMHPHKNRMYSVGWDALSRHTDVRHVLVGECLYVESSEVHSGVSG